MFSAPANSKSSNTIAPAVAAGVGPSGIKAAVVRSKYVAKAAALKPIYENGTLQEKIAASDTRNKLIVETRLNTPEPYRSIAEDMKATGTLENKPLSRFYKTNTAVNAKMTGVGMGAGALTAYGLYQSYENIKNSDNKLQQTAVEGGSWAGAMYLGGQGAIYGTSIGGPVGGAVGGVVGGVIGGTLGRGAVESAFSMYPVRSLPIPESVKNNTAPTDNTRVEVKKY